MHPPARPAARAMVLFGLLCSVLLAGCSPVYGPATSAGSNGFSERQVAPDVWRVRYQAGPGINWNSLRSYWLQRAAEVTLAQGYDGFELITDVALGSATQPTDETPFQLASIMIIPVFIPAGAPPTNYALLEGDIRLLRAPIRPVPFKLLDARRLQAALAPYLANLTCNGRNVCPHETTYLKAP